MAWYYAEGALQNGPVPDEEFAELVRNGKVRGETLVWRDGMGNWQPYATVAGSVSGAPPPILTTPAAPAQPLAANEVLCQECGKVVPRENAIQYGSVWVCANCKPMFVQKLREGATMPVAAGQLPYAGFWIRLGAKFIDGLILGIVVIVPAMIFFFQAVIAGGGPDPQAQLVFQLIFQLAYLGVQVAFNTFFVGKFGATPGKMACGLRVVMSDGSRLTYGRAFGRACAEILSNLICSIGYIIAAFDDQKRTLHDHMCDTRVIRK
jgi:uncharacterized RDD family membrane protein YckC